MTEINNQFSNRINHISAKFDNKQVENNNQHLEYTNAKELSAEMGILGKSQISRPDNIQSDIEFCLKQSPEFLSKCDKFFEQSLTQFENAGDEFAYEKACVLSKEFANEFV